MRWLKHMTNSNRDPALVKFKTEFGLEAYGFFWLILEIIAEQMDSKNNTFCDYSEKIWLDFLGISSKKFHKMLNFCKKNKIFIIRKRKSGIYIDCPNLIKYRDEYTRKKNDLSGATPEFVRSNSDSRVESEKENGEREGDNRASVATQTLSDQSYTLKNIVDINKKQLGYVPNENEVKIIESWVGRLPNQEIDFAYSETTGKNIKSFKYVKSIIDRMLSNNGALRETVLGNVHKFIEKNDQATLGNLISQYSGKHKDVLREILIAAGITAEHINKKLKDLPIEKLFKS